MARIIGVEIPDNKKASIALTSIYGVGRVNVVEILKKAKVSPAKRVNELKSEEIARISKVLSEVKTEGVLRQEEVENIKRLKNIGTYRGERHAKGLPVRGQRTRTNARTKRGKRVTIGAIRRKEAASKTSEEPQVKKEDKK